MGWISTDDAVPLRKEHRRVLAAIHHGPMGYFVCEAEVYSSGSLHHVAEDSCVGWRRGHPHPAFWQPFPAFELPSPAILNVTKGD